MQLQKLSLTNFRAFKQAEFEFKPGMNLIVGINGVGKSSSLDAIRILFSQALPQFSRSRNKKIKFRDQYISYGYDHMVASLAFSIDGQPFTFSMDQPRDEHLGLKPNVKQVNEELKRRSNQPLVVYYSATRSSFTLRKPDQGFDDALIPREMNIQRFAAWWLARKALLSENDNQIDRKKINILEMVVTKFIDGYSNLKVMQVTFQHEDKLGHITETDEIALRINKGDAILNILQLSDGERGMLALVLDLARRLIDANPGLADPLAEGRAVVLIDELDLHLHPRWQREIVQKLTTTFPNCQFIATTHSPQIVGEVLPENIIILEEGKQPYRPDQSLGMDTNWILRFLMGTDERNVKSRKELERIAKLIENEEYDKAETLIDKARVKYGETPDLVRLQSRIDGIRILGE